MFAEQYARSLQSSDLRDDAHHTSTEALFAAAIASKTGTGLGALLSRVKYADGRLTDEFSRGSTNLAQLLRIWTDLVVAKGIGRAWIGVRSAWDMDAAQLMYRRIARASLAYWIDSRCLECNGAGVLATRRYCPACKGAGKTGLGEGIGGIERDRIMEMVGELEGLVRAHNARAAGIMRRRE